MFRYQPPEPDRVVRTIRDGSGIAREEQTLKHLMSGWLPVNTQLLHSIDRDFEAGAYELLETSTKLNLHK